jgi:hypothetical protein
VTGHGPLTGLSAIEGGLGKLITFVEGGIRPRSGLLDAIYVLPDSRDPTEHRYPGHPLVIRSVVSLERGRELSPYAEV